MGEERIDLLMRKVDMIEQQLALLLDAIVVQQKDACEIAGVSKDTPRNRFKSGDLEVLSRDGSRLNYITLTNAGRLKKRRRVGK